MSVADRPFLSDQWYRVAHLAPRLAPQVRMARRRGPGGAHYLLFDSLTGRSHRLNLAAAQLVAQMDGRAGFGDAWEDVVDRMGEAGPTQEEAVRLLSDLHAQDLVITDLVPDIAERAERRSKQDRKLLKQNLMGPLSTRIPLFDPDALLRVTAPLVWPLTGKVGALLWLVFMLYAGTLALAEAEAIAGAFTDQVWTAGSIAMIAGTYVAMKTLHELGHGWVAQRHGVRIPEFGIMLLIFMPVPYVDATESARLESRWARAWISAAGIVVETALAAAAFLLWREADPGPWRAMLFNVMLVGGISTILINGNPLLKFDGYFVLCDVLGLPNLAQRANRAWGDWTNGALFAARDVRPRPATRGELLAYAIYAPAAFGYRIVLSIGIGLYVASSFFLLGVVLAIWSLTLSVGRPIGKGLWHVATSPLLRRTRTRAWTITGGGSAVVVLALFVVPVPHATWTQGVIRAPEGAELVAAAEGEVGSVAATAGEAVSAGAVLLSLSDPLSGLRLEALAARLRAEELERLIAAQEGPAAEKLARIAVEGAQAALRREKAHATDRRLTASVAGTFRLVAAPEDMVGRHVRRGEVLGHVLPGTVDRVRLVALQAQVRAIERGVRRTELRLPHDSRTYPAVLEGRISTGAFDLPSPLLARTAGGPVPAAPGENGLQATERVFVYDAILPPGLDAPIGGRVHVKLVHPWRPVGQRMVNAVRRTLAGLIEL